MINDLHPVILQNAKNVVKIATLPQFPTGIPIEGLSQILFINLFENTEDTGFIIINYTLDSQGMFVVDDGQSYLRIITNEHKCTYFIPDDWEISNSFTFGPQSNIKTGGTSVMFNCIDSDIIYPELDFNEVYLTLYIPSTFPTLPSLISVEFLIPPGQNFNC